MEKIIVTGAKGQLGSALVNELEERGYTEVLGIDYEDADITNEEVIKSLIRNYNPTVVYHCAAYVQVDKAETEKEKCEDINVNGTKYISEVCSEIGSKLFYISTDYVFDGTKDGIYEVNDKPNPQSVYGETKYRGEIEALKNLRTFVVRISWVFGNGNNFVKTMLRLAETRTEISVVDDQIGSPTYTVDLSRLLVDMLEASRYENHYGIYHATNEGYCSWCDFAKEIFRLCGINMKVNPITTEQYNINNAGKVIANRPMNSKLNKKELDDNGFRRLPSWEDAIDRYIKELKK